VFATSKTPAKVMGKNSTKAERSTRLVVAAMPSNVRSHRRARHGFCAARWWRARPGALRC
jgi:hypothetical protein